MGDNMNKFSFIKGVEKLVDPISVGSLHFIQFFNSLLPKKMQKALIKSSSKKIPYMGFIVEPYAYFLCYEIEDLDYAKRLIPDNFRLVKTKIFNNDDSKYYIIFGCINARTSAFFGSRVEMYIIAENKDTNLLSWIIIDYDSNTISYDNKNGLSNIGSKTIITTSYDGNIIVDIEDKKQTRKLVFDSDITKGVMTKLDQRLWLEGNLSIGYGKEISRNGDIFSLKFNKGEVEKALKIPITSLNLISNTWFKGLFKDKPEQLVCFPYAQHFLSDSPFNSSNLKSEKELHKSINNIDFNNIKVFSTKSFKIMFLVGSITSFLITLLLIILLFTK